MTYRRPPEPPRPPRQQSLLDSPVVTGLLLVIVVLLGVVVLLVTGVFAPSAPGASSSPPPGVSPGPTGPTAEPTFVRPTPSPAPTFVSYRVQSGDSLNSIARKYRTTARSIAWWNRGAYPSLDPQSPKYDPGTIRVGWVLVVLPDSVVDESNPPTPSPGPPTPTPDPNATPEPDATLPAP
jgi:hypothetical protein